MSAVVIHAYVDDDRFNRHVHMPGDYIYCGSKCRSTRVSTPDAVEMLRVQSEYLVLKAVILEMYYEAGK
jgi:hypothetical protein